MVQLHQLFIRKISRSEIFDFISNCSVDLIRDDKYYVINETSFKKSVLDGTLQKFCVLICPCYIKSKRGYIENVNTYPHFLTIIRQVCRMHDISINKKRQSSGKKTIHVYHIFNPDVSTEPVSEDNHPE